MNRVTNITSVVKFSVNGTKCEVGAEVGAETSLNAYLRYHLNLRGTKAMCHEGGCGACIVSARVRHPVTGLLETLAVNSCLVLVFSCDGWEVTTVEGLGDRLKGYHPIQTRLKDFHGSQCGYCSPGWVMSMYSLLDKNLTMAELEKSFGSNTCRCTGYRPILDTVKSFATDASPDLYRRVQDIEELHRRPACSGTVRPCAGRAPCPDRQEEHDWCVIGSHDLSELGADPIIQIDFKDHTFNKANTVDDIFTFLTKYRCSDYMLIAGNTGKGVLENFSYPRHLIDINDVAELKAHEVNQNLVLGGGVSLENAKTLFQNLSETEPEFAYLSKFGEHFDLIAHLPVRNVEGAFVQGLGYWTSEKPKYDVRTGRLLTNRSWNYKVPLALDIPADFRVKLRYNSRNSTGVLGSKAVGESPLCMSVVITHALRECILASRKESGYDVSQWLDICVPYDLESILLATDANIDEFVLSI